MVPLNVLLSHALLDLTRACERAGAEEVVLWSNFLRVFGEDGVERNALPSTVRLSKRAVKTTVGALTRHGWARVDGGVVRLTEQAGRARDEWGAAMALAESAWPAATSLRAPLEAFVSRLPPTPRTTTQRPERSVGTRFARPSRASTSMPTATPTIQTSASSEAESGSPRSRRAGRSASVSDLQPSRWSASLHDGRPSDPLIVHRTNLVGPISGAKLRIKS